MSVELTRKTGWAAEAQKDASDKFHIAANRLQDATAAHEKGKWHRVRMNALIGTLCAAVGFFAREPASKFEHLWDARAALKQDAADGDCKTLGGETMPSEGKMVCVIWQDPS